MTTPKLNEFLVRFDDNGNFVAAHFVLKVVEVDSNGVKTGERLYPAQPIDANAPADLKAFLGDALAAALQKTDESIRAVEVAEQLADATKAEAARAIKTAENSAAAIKSQADLDVAEARTAQYRAESVAKQLSDQLLLREQEIAALTMRLNEAGVTSQQPENVA